MILVTSTEVNLGCQVKDLSTNFSPTVAQAQNPHCKLPEGRIAIIVMFLKTVVNIRLYII